MIFFELFYTFFLVGLFTFGGGYAMIPMIEEQVLSKGWISQSALQDFIAISEITPGPFAINISTFVGNSVGGVLGAFCATLGVILPSFIIILIIAALLKHFMKNRFVKAGINGIKPTVLALLASTVIIFFIQNVFFNNGKIGSNYFFDLTSLTLSITLLGLYIILKKKTKRGLGPISLLAISAVLGIILFI